MSNIKVRTLELALSKFIEASNTEIINDKKAFNEIAQNILKKKQATDGLKSYLKSDQTSPRVLGVMIYSEAGRKHLKKWIEQGMSTKILYRAMFHDGAFWHKANQEFPLYEEICNGGKEWDLDAKELLSSAGVLTALPGLLEAIVERMRYKGLIQEVFYYLPEIVISELLQDNPSIFAEEVDEVEKKMKSNGVLGKSVTANNLIGHYLDDQIRVEKLLGQKIRNISA